MKTFRPGFLTGFLICSLPFLLFTCSQKSTERIGVIQQAFNTEKIDSTIARCYSADIEYEIAEVKGQGKQMLRGVAEWDSVINTHRLFSDFKASGDTIFCKCVEQNDLSTLQGLDKIYFDPVLFIFQDSRILQMKFRNTLESHKAKVKAAAPFLHWLYNQRNDRLPQLLTGGKFVLNAPTATTYLALGREWYETAGINEVR
jgi:hypothetical protein